MKYLPLFLLLTVFSCDKEDAKPATPDNSVRVFVGGDLYFTGEDNLFNAIDRTIDSDGNEEFDILLFATGKNDPAEDFSLLVGVTSLSNPSELVPQLTSISFTQIGNECSGTLFLTPDNFTIDISGRNGAYSGTMDFTTSGTGCVTDFTVEFSGVEVSE